MRRLTLVCVAPLVLNGEGSLKNVDENVLEHSMIAMFFKEGH
uniref:Uncharacterized protein LOC8288482 n=1 Tax=Rhizophora mucronata TaxID=61149 RepID=A0A2P2MMG7_RHIMU